MRKTNVFILFFSFVIYGWVEFELLIFIGSIVGGLISFLGLFFTAFVGISLIRLSSKKVFMAWQSEYQKHQYGLSKLAEGLSILFGGLLLIVPGYFTDLIGIICMIPIIRVFIRSIIITNCAELRVFANLRRKHSGEPRYHEESKFEAEKIIIDGEYKEK